MKVQRAVLSIAALLVCAGLGCAGCAQRERYEPEVPGGDARRGADLVAALECGACHRIPGVPGAVGYVGPPLDNFRSSVYIAGLYPNTPDVLVQFVRDAPSLAPETAMPAIAMSEDEARHIAAFLYSLR